MGIFGTILGGAVGGLLGGPLGVVMGSFLGAHLSENARVGGMPRPGPAANGGYARSARRPGHTAQDLQAVFAIALTSLAAKVAKADGRVTQEEIQAFDTFLRNSMHMSVEERKYAAEVFNEARHSPSPAADFARQVRGLLRGQPDRLRDIITILLAIALADGHYHPREEEMILGIAREMGLSQADYQSCRATFMAARGEPEVSPYEVLGVSPSASDDEVRKAHRRLVREYHPDVAKAKGLPDDFLDFAHEKMSAINEAWSRVKKERNM